VDNAKKEWGIFVQYANHQSKYSLLKLNKRLDAHYVKSYIIDLAYQPENVNAKKMNDIGCYLLS
jgi:hypothetical protein